MCKNIILNLRGTTKTIQNNNVKLSEINVLIGPNGSGKSLLLKEINQCLVYNFRNNNNKNKILENINFACFTDADLDWVKSIIEVDDHGNYLIQSGLSIE